MRKMGSQWNEALVLLLILKDAVPKQHNSTSRQCEVLHSLRLSVQICSNLVEYTKLLEPPCGMVL